MNLQFNENSKHDLTLKLIFWIVCIGINLNMYLIVRMHTFQKKQVSAEASVQFVKVSPKLNDLLLNCEGASVSV